MKTPAVTLSLFCLMTRYPDEAAATKFFESRRWGDTPVCTHCGSTQSFPRPERHGHRFRSCRKDFSVRVGTIMERSHIPLRKWMVAAYMLQTARKGVSSLQLSKELHITQKAAWFLEHRIRAACGSGLDGELLSGIIEVDETFVGGIDENRHECKKFGAESHGGKVAVLGLRERGEGGRTVALPIPDVKRETLHGAIHAHVASGSVLMTDDLMSYRSLDGEKYQHQSVCHSAKEFVNGMAHTNGIESVWAVLKRGFNGVYHHWSVKHLARYVDEFTFRLNEGNVRRDTIDRLHSVIDGMVGKRLTYAELTA